MLDLLMGWRRAGARAERNDCPALRRSEHVRAARRQDPHQRATGSPAALGYAAIGSAIHRRTRGLGTLRRLVVLEPQHGVSKIFLGVPLQQHKDAPEEFAKGKMVGDDDAAVMLSRVCVLPRQPDKVFDVEGQNGSTLTGCERQLLAV